MSWTAWTLAWSHHALELADAVQTISKLLQMIQSTTKFRKILIYNYLVQYFHHLRHFLLFTCQKAFLVNYSLFRANIYEYHHLERFTFPARI
jgi:hypothetical protein